MRAPATVLAVCVNFNGRLVLPRTLECLGRVRRPGWRAMVVDSASDDGSPDLVPPSMELVRLESNRGYAAGLNAAVARQRRNQAGGQTGWDVDYFLFLNNDVEFEPEMVDRLVEFAEISGPGVFGPKVLRLDRPKRLEAAWGNVSWSHVLARYVGKNALDGPRWNRVRRVELLLGCALLVHRRVLEETGLFDERFFMYHEEVDFLFRAGLRGFPVYFCPFAEIRHEGGHASGRLPRRKVYWLRRNAALFLRKHRAGPGRWLLWGATLLASLAFNLVTLRWRRATAIAKGAWDGVREGLGDA